MWFFILLGLTMLLSEIMNRMVIRGNAKRSAFANPSAAVNAHVEVQAIAVALPSNFEYAMWVSLAPVLGLMGYGYYVTTGG